MLLSALEKYNINSLCLLNQIAHCYECASYYFSGKKSENFP